MQTYAGIEAIKRSAHIAELAKNGELKYYSEKGTLKRVKLPGWIFDVGVWTDLAKDGTLGIDVQIGDAFLNSRIHRGYRFEDALSEKTPTNMKAFVEKTASLFLLDVSVLEPEYSPQWKDYANYANNARYEKTKAGLVGVLEGAITEAIS